MVFSYEVEPLLEQTSYGAAVAKAEHNLRLKKQDKKKEVFWPLFSFVLLLGILVGMLPRQNRLRNQEFKGITYTNRREHSTHLILAYSETAHDFKAVVIVGKKVFKKAVDRNKVRRGLYGVLAQNKPALQHGVYIVRVKTSAQYTSSTQLQQELQQLLNRLITAV